MDNHSLEQKLMRFKMDLLGKLPFYGDLLMNIPIVEDPSVQTACTDGRTIRYNPSFMNAKETGEQNYVLMHEVMHLMLMHCVRGAGKEDDDLYNVAADVVVNNILNRLRYDMQLQKIPFQTPKDTLYASIPDSQTAEDLYELMLKDNRNRKKGKVIIRNSYVYSGKTRECDVPSRDLIGKGFGDLVSPETLKQLEQIVQGLLRHANGAKSRSPFGSYYVPEGLYCLTESRRLPWNRLLREFLEEETDDEVSYITPERKYLHMDLILPGHGDHVECLENIWAFVDSSGSVSNEEMNQFLTQLYRIVKEFKCKMNIVYWDTQVTDVYRDLVGENKVLQSIPHHSGGTDINCIYRWITETRTNPEVMLILSDGYFGSLNPGVFLPALRKKTILVITDKGLVNEETKQIGKVARL